MMINPIIKRSATILTALFLMGIFFFAVANEKNAFSKLTDKENARSLQWLKQNKSASAESALMKALVSFHYLPSLTLLPFRSSELGDSKRRIILSLMIFQCTDYPKFSHCDGASLENQLIKLHPKNLFPYLLQFNHFIAKGDTNSALTSLEKGLTTTETNDYFFDKVLYLRSELESIEIRGSRANLAAEEYSGNGLGQVYINIMPTCAEQAKASHEWESVCLALSYRLEQGTTFLPNVVGAALRRDVLKATSSDKKKIQAAVEHRAFYNDFRDNASSKFPRWKDPTQRPDSYYKNAVEFGELQAVKMMIDQVSNTPVQ